ncbi:MAG: trehalose-phosphatase [Defluviicoccus sp.]|nr:trehalose-phosphatase [Defluviicoccus sp.]
MQPPALPEPRAHWALFLDFDGSIVEIAPTPDSIVVPETLPPLLTALRGALGGAVAIVTGRPIAQIDAYLGAAVPAVAGLHGLERRGADGAIVRPPPNDDLRRARAPLEAFAAAHPGILFEDKEYSLALHYRLAPSLEDACRDVVDSVLGDGAEGWEILEGKMVFEIRPRGLAKGAAIEAFMGEAPFVGRIPVFCGDDITDEDGFAVVNARGGVSVRVGERAATRAAVRVDTVADLLDWLVRVAGSARLSA